MGWRSLPRHLSVLWRDARNGDLGSHVFGFARHTNTDSVRRVRWSVRECGTAVLGDMPSTPRLLTTLPGLRGRVRRAATRTPGAGGTPSAKRHKKQWTQPPKAVRERPHKRGRVDRAPPPPPPDTGAYASPVSVASWPPPPSQESTHAAAGHHTAWASGDGGDITPTPRRFWPRRGPPPRPEQALETGPEAFMTAPLVFEAGASGDRWGPAGLPL